MNFFKKKIRILESTFSQMNYSFRKKNKTVKYIVIHYTGMKNLNLDNFDGEFYLYGQPFFYDEQWWLYKSFEPKRNLIAFVCSDSCFTSWQDFAKPEPISFARSYPEDPSGNSLMLLSGSVSFIRIL